MAVRHGARGSSSAMAFVVLSVACSDGTIVPDQQSPQGGPRLQLLPGSVGASEGRTSAGCLDCADSGIGAAPSGEDPAPTAPTGSGSGSPAPAPDSEPDGSSGRPPVTDPGEPPPLGACDPTFLGPFCTGTVCDAEGNCETVEDNIRIIGFSQPEPQNPTVDELRAYSLAALNAIRARTCLPPLVMDECLHQIAEEALAAGSGHGYFLQNCMNGSTGYGRRCECHWTQENIGASAGTGRTWVDGVQNPLCRMMTEPKGQGHRANIESPVWVRVGIGIAASRSGATWYHEFGCDPSLAECPKNP